MTTFSSSTGGPIGSSDATSRINQFKSQHSTLTVSNSLGKEYILKMALFFEENPEYTGVVIFNSISPDTGAIKPIFYPRKDNGNLGNFKSVLGSGNGFDDPVGIDFTAECPSECTCEPDDPECIV